MGLMDKVKGAAAGVQNKAANAITAKRETHEMEKAAKQADKQNQAELAAIYRPTNTMGDVSIDSNNRLFKVRRASAELPKKAGAMAMTGKALAAVYTLGASVAIEQAMKPDDRIFSFDELRSFELIEDDAQVVGGGVGMALVGGAFFGDAGMIAGSIIGGKKTKGTVENLILQINLKSMDMPCVLIPYVTKTVKKSSNDYKRALSAARETISSLELIAEDCEARAGADPVEELKKMKELLDLGIIDQDGFNAKKAELLKAM